MAGMSCVEAKPKRYRTKKIILSDEQFDVVLTNIKHNQDLIGNISSYFTEMISITKDQYIKLLKLIDSKMYKYSFPYNLAEMIIWTRLDFSFDEIKEICDITFKKWPIADIESKRISTVSNMLSETEINDTYNYIQTSLKPIMYWAMVNKRKFNKKLSFAIDLLKKLSVSDALITAFVANLFNTFGNDKLANEMNDKMIKKYHNYIPIKILLYLYRRHPENKEYTESIELYIRNSLRTICSDIFGTFDENLVKIDFKLDIPSILIKQDMDEENGDIKF